jgi:hypothetical protein
MRYRLLETVREFALLQLATAGELAETRQRLRSWAMDEAATAFECLYSREQVAVVQHVGVEEGNLVEVLRHCLQEQDLPGAVVVFAGLAEFWTIEGTHLKVLSMATDMGSLLLSGGLKQSGLERLRELTPALRSQRLIQSARLLLATAPRNIVESVQVLETLADDADPVLARMARTWAAAAYENEGNLVVARAMAEGALALCDDRVGPWLRALPITQLGSFALQSGDFAAARAYQLESLRAAAAARSA